MQAREDGMDHRQFCDRFMAALQAGDRDALAGMMHPDFRVEEAESLPYGGVYHGVDGWMTLARAVTKTWKGFQISPIEFPGGSQDRFLVRFRISGASRRTGKPFESTVLELWSFREDRLIEIAPYYFDTHALVMADTP
jgi:ketosteroid isomerase-like protein